ncbi:TetR/AcrR family transcriptional regulator [Micromonospora sp. NPDC003197]
MVVRGDVVRNRQRLLGAAAEMRRRGKPLQLNAVAHEAGVGVGTVYRHFADVEELTEALVHDGFAQLEAQARDITDAASLRVFLARALDILVTDGDFATVATNPAPALPMTAEARASLLAVLSEGIAHAQRDSATPTPLTPEDVLMLLCGLAYAIRRSGATGERARLYLDAFLRGVFPTPAE